jgi:hypothetical protein
MKKLLLFTLLSTLAFSASVLAQSADLGREISIRAVQLRTEKLPYVSLRYDNINGQSSVLIRDMEIDIGRYNSSEILSIRTPESQKNSTAQAICNKLGLGDLIKVGLSSHQVPFVSKYIENGIVAHTNNSLKMVFALHSELSSLYPADSKLIDISSIECKRLEPVNNSNQISIRKLE